MLEKYDVVYATCLGRSKNGTFVTIDISNGNCIRGFIPKVYLNAGEQVMCSISYEKDDNFYILALDSILFDPMVA